MFVAVVERIGVDIAVPSQILTAMGKHAKGLTRQNIASHLQKYRNRCVARECLPSKLLVVDWNNPPMGTRYILHSDVILLCF